MKTEEWVANLIKKKLAGQQLQIRDFQHCRVWDVPDLFLFSGPNGGWMELKVIPGYNSQLPLRKGQVKWIEDYIADGGVAWIFVLIDRKDFITFTLFSGRKIRELVARKYCDLGPELGWLYSAPIDERTAWTGLSETLQAGFVRYPNPPDE